MTLNKSILLGVATFMFTTCQTIETDMSTWCGGTALLLTGGVAGWFIKEKVDKRTGQARKEETKRFIKNVWEQFGDEHAAISSGRFGGKELNNIIKQRYGADPYPELAYHENLEMHTKHLQEVKSATREEDEAELEQVRSLFLQIKHTKNSTKGAEIQAQRIAKAQDLERKERTKLELQKLEAAVGTEEQQTRIMHLEEQALTRQERIMSDIAQELHRIHDKLERSTSTERETNTALSQLRELTRHAIETQASLPELIAALRQEQQSTSQAQARLLNNILEALQHLEEHQQAAAADTSYPSPSAPPL